MDLDVRTISDDEVPAWCAALNVGFLNPAGDVDAEVRRPGLFLDRTWGGFEGARIVATLRSFPSEMTMPGGAAVGVSAVTAVTTTVPFRRRGLASRLLAGELAAAKERGEAASILIAAEWGIYGRFGYGPATEHQTLTVDSSRARIREVPDGTVDFADQDTARTLVADAYDRHRAMHPGEIARPERFWDIDFGIIRYPSWKELKAGFFVVARGTGGAVVGLARYEVTEEWVGRLPASQVSVNWFISAGPAGDALLWHHLLSIDLAMRVQVGDRGPDDLVPWLLIDARHVRPSDRSDFLWVRPLDIAALLSARSYPASGHLVLEAVDRSGLSGGRFALEGGPEGAQCTPTTASPDVTLDISTLGSVSLGGHSVATIAAAGLIDEHAPGAVATADAMFRSPVAPWCSTWF
jgi:predicted acetyltransferase